MAAWNVVKTFWNHVFEEYNICLNALQWSPPVQLLINAIACKTRKEMMDLIEHTYTDLSTARLAKLLGISETDVIPCKMTAFDSSLCRIHLFTRCGRTRVEDDG